MAVDDGDQNATRFHPQAGCRMTATFPTPSYLKMTVRRRGQQRESIVVPVAWHVGCFSTQAVKPGDN